MDHLKIVGQGERKPCTEHALKKSPGDRGRIYSKPLSPGYNLVEDRDENIEKWDPTA